MKPLVRLAPQCIRIATTPRQCQVCLTTLNVSLIRRRFATIPPNQQNDEQGRSNNDNPSNQDLQHKSTTETNLPSSQDSPPPPSAENYPQAYSIPSEDQEQTVQPISSRDWKEIEAELDPPPPNTWTSPNDPVPLQRDYPMSKGDFLSLPDHEKARIAYDSWKREKQDFIQSEKLYDSTHLHPPGTPFKMPMVAYHRNYAPVSETPPPVQEVPWQLRGPWRWVRTVGIVMISGAVLALLAGWIVKHRDEYRLRNLEAKNPAPGNWNEKARGYWAVAMDHRLKGETQMAVWALQRALVEAGYQWVLEPETIPKGENRTLDPDNAYLVRVMILWEIDLEHWEKALGLSRALFTLYQDDSSLNRARKCDILRILALPTEKAKGIKAADEMFKQSLSYGGLNLPKDHKTPITIPLEMKPSPYLLRALDDYVVFQVRNRLKTPKQVVPTLLSLASVYREIPPETRDLCAEGSVLLHLGELMYALGHPDESLQWTLKAVQSTRRALPQQKQEEDRQRCSECIGNGMNSLGILYEV